MKEEKGRYWKRRKKDVGRGERRKLEEEKERKKLEAYKERRGRNLEEKKEEGR